MDLIYTVYRSQGSLRKAPDWAQEGNSLTAVSSQNSLLFTSATLLSTGEPALASWGSHVYCVDLNTPWEPSLVCSLESGVSCLAWDESGTRFLCADTTGQLAVWEMEESSLADWRQVASTRHAGERFITGGFFLRSRPVSLNLDQKESWLYTTKFSAAVPAWSRAAVDGCLAVSATGLLVSLGLPPDREEVEVETSRLGPARRRILLADVGTGRAGELLVATSGTEGPVTVHRVVPGLHPDGRLAVRLHTHSSFNLQAEQDHLTELRFLLPDTADTLLVGLSGPEGGRVQLWSFEARQKTVHKLLNGGGGGHAATPRTLPEWRRCDELQCGGAGVVALSSPRSSVLGGRKPACFIAVALSDGSVQLLLRDGLAQIASVELPRTGNTAWSRNTNHRVSLTICSLAFTATGNCLLAADSLGQLYLYRLSPIADPGGPPLAPYIVTMLEYCLVSGRDWWDLAVAAKPSKLEFICDKFAENFGRQGPGEKEYYASRFLAIKASLLRLSPSTQQRASHTNATLMLNSINGAFRSLLRGGEYSGLDLTDPLDKFELILSSTEEDKLDVVCGQLAGAGLGREPHLEPGTGQLLQQLTLWVATLALHLLATVPELKGRAGPGHSLAQDGAALRRLRELLAIARLWSLSRVSIITTQKDVDLTATLFSLVTRLVRSPEDEGLVDECLMLPHKVMIPPLDTLLSPRGVNSCLHNLPGSPLLFTFCSAPDLPAAAPPPHADSLTYTDHASSDFHYDSVAKLYLGKRPGGLKRCTRCSAVTQNVSHIKNNFAKLWDKRWNRKCQCGGSWKLSKD